MYQDKTVVAIKVNGKVLRENGDAVGLPFGCEYSILIKNLNSVRSQVMVSVDGNDAAGRLIIGPNSNIELERFIRNGNLQTGNRFKFIERTEGIEAHRGIGADDGIVRVEAWREHVPRFVDRPMPRYYDYPIPRPYPYRPGLPRCSAIPRPDMMSALSKNPGITVPGSQSNQTFRTVNGFPLESTSVVLVVKLQGEIGGNPVETPITVDMKPECNICGKTNEATHQFCDLCGSALVLI